MQVNICKCMHAGMELMANKFQVIVTQMRKKPYDYLDQRKMDFDQDFEDFKRQINELHVSNQNINNDILTWIWIFLLIVGTCVLIRTMNSSQRLLLARCKLYPYY